MPVSTPSSRTAPLLLGALVLLATALSVLRTGFVFGISNNVYHVPLVLEWTALSAFADDAFYATLGKFTSVVWPLVGAVASESNAGLVFFAGHVLSRGLALLAIGWLLVGHFRLPVQGVALALLVCVLTPWMVGASTLGVHGLWLSYFTHSEVTWGPFLAALGAALASRWVLAAALAGVVFSINAFVGVWLLAMLGTAFVVPGAERPWRQVGPGALAFALTAAPALLWILRSMGGGGVAFSYLEYIRTYYPEHFLIEAASPRELAIAGVSACVGVAAAVLTPRPRFWLAALGACALVFCAGAVLPYVLDHRIVFNLHMLRIEGVVHWLSVVLAVAVLCLRLGEGRDPVVRVFAMVGLLSLLSTLREPMGLAFTALSLAAIAGLEHAPARLPAGLRERRMGMALVFTGLVVALGAWRWEWTWLNACAWLLMVFWAVCLQAGRVPRQPLWLFLPIAVCALMPRWDEPLAFSLEASHPDGLTELTTWVREHRVEGPFLITLGGPDDDHDFFQLLSRQPVWVDWKQGAAVMWEPGFHAQWMPRYLEVRELKTPSDFARYARANQLKRFIVHQQGAECPTATRQRFRGGLYLMCELE